VADIADVSGGGVAGKTEVRIEGRKSDKAALLLTERRPRPVETPVNVEGSEVNQKNSPLECRIGGNGDDGLVQTDGRTPADGTNLVGSRDPKLTGVAIDGLALWHIPNITRDISLRSGRHTVQAVDSAGTTNTQDHGSTRSHSPPLNFTSVR
jgi:hypothetical protein